MGCLPQKRVHTNNDLLNYQHDQPPSANIQPQENEVIKSRVPSKIINEKWKDLVTKYFKEVKSKKKTGSSGSAAEYQYHLSNSQLTQVVKKSKEEMLQM